MLQKRQQQRRQKQPLQRTRNTHMHTHVTKKKQKPHEKLNFYVCGNVKVCVKINACKTENKLKQNGNKIKSLKT